MTTIAATTEGMAADSMVVLPSKGSYRAAKLFRMPDGSIIGAAGHNEAIQRFFEWWPLRDTQKRRVPKRLSFEAIVLTHAGLYVFDHSGPPDLVTDGVIAIGTGQDIAIAAFDTMRLLNRKLDPRIAVEVACGRHAESKGPVQYMKLKKK